MNLWRIRCINSDGISIVILVEKDSLEQCLTYAKSFAKERDLMLQAIEQCYVKTEKKYPKGNKQRR